MAEKNHTQICAREKAPAKLAVNHPKNEKLAKRAAIICRGYNRALKHRVSEAAS